MADSVDHKLNEIRFHYLFLKDVERDNYNKDLYGVHIKSILC